MGCRRGNFITDGEGNGKKVRTPYGMGNVITIIAYLRR